jgi:F0F1-type ATP synthase delta subunit
MVDALFTSVTDVAFQVNPGVIGGLLVDFGDKTSEYSSSVGHHASDRS